ncbi:MAG: T9SS type A sorting domain-containing protein [Bacteroidia bacterium]|nr:T9SS type A sorting domain-containing protein [Bacteroidia bacterium]
MKNLRYTTLAILFTLLTIIFNAQSQIVLSSFDFNSIPLTTATAGPNATSVNNNAETDGRGVCFQTSGANVGVDLVLPTASILSNLSSLDLVMEFARNEGTAYLFEGGSNNLRLEGGVLYFTYAARRNANNNNNPVIVTLQYGGLPVSSSGQFSTIRAAYDAVTGVGALFVNNSLVASNQGTANRPLVWTGADNFTIGRMMDGSGNGFVMLGSFALHSGLISALPVELVSFSALKRANTVELRWNTATELNNYGFEVERSFDKKHWEVLDFVPGHGTVNSPRSYTWSDASALRSNRNDVHYRLRQIDRDGSFEYSSVVSVSLHGETGFAIQPAFPNPFNPSTTFTLRLQTEESVHVCVADASGRIVATLVNGEILSAGTHNISFHADDLPSGLYFAMVRTATQSGSIKLMLQK